MASSESAQQPDTIFVSGASPHGTWPHDGPADPATVALLLIDMQYDFLGEKGYIAAAGHADAAAEGRTGVARLKTVLDAARRAGLRVLHTREGHRPSLNDLPSYKRWRQEGPLH